MSTTALILAGGAGTRLRPLTYHRPKPMVPIANKPILQYQMELMRRHGISEIVLCVGAGTDAVRDYFGNGDSLGIKIHYSIEDTPLGTAGAVKNAEQYLGSGSFLIMNGDGLVDYDLSSIISFHYYKNADVTIGLMKVPTPTPCGIVKTDSDNRVISFEEPDKTQKKTLGTNAATTGFALVNAGVYLISSESLRSIPKGREFSMESEFFPSMIANGKNVYASLLFGKGLDIGAPNQYLNAHYELFAGKIDAEIAGQPTEGGYRMEGDSEIDPSAKIDSGVYIGPGCRIGPHAKISEYSSVGPGCIIGENTVINASALLENVTIGNNCLLRACIIDCDSTVGDDITLGNESILPKGSVLKAISNR
ncbi:MAG: NDP-sugar synthase [Armatimonadota bacterium]